ncbi:methylenetetrahydrofolate reductase [NAD(P)H] [Henriciella mobilis]|uniref:Methylenetetrahydrofolate reductase n=1 Tax=Henriciella mobilis TaxID=2305467 RepID=A0A399RHI1_9PROT|nr:methylenetetrahydrofolate reductase [NAD(P)H] [Henriciella mobilis]RIJ18283.1 methylenetetrahydrofolate reductase [NAD(P)H] [Henriciella mobilis]RIJ24912.1 methylenetetrahydrofolate reductase [NAD(P)H] [Henriciella mobilis]RIJ29973.1 methylenetetrahydrofolate reductase [NAD(P)H] [Henriciella mobilis]
MSDLSVAARQAGKTPSVSFEFFPPKNESMTEKLWECVRRLEPMSPHFVSVTYGAGGSTRTRTHETVSRIARETSLTPAAHLTCVGAPREEVLQTAEDYYEAGVRHIVALRGDAPQDEDFKQPEGRYTSVVDLVSDLRAHRPDLGKVFEVSVACYPEPHPDSRGWEADLAHLKRKQDAGADRAITQFFFDPDVYFDFVDKARGAGITMPIVPGIMLQSNFKGLKNFAKMCGASLPDWLHKLYEGLDDDATTRDLITANVAAELCHKLADGGVNQFHFYTLNKADLALSTCHLLGLKPAHAEAA